MTYYMGKSMREELLKLIESNSKISPSDLSKMLNVSEIDIVNELAKLEKENVICGYQTLIDWDKTNVNNVVGLIEVRITPERGNGFDKIAERIYNYEEVKSLYLISGAYDLLVTLEEANLKDVAEFVFDKLSTIDGVVSTATHFILKKYKEHGTIFNKIENDKREAVSL